MLFIFIDRTDEFQLVDYLLSFKAFQFVTGLMSAARLGIQFWTCLERTGLHHTTKYSDNSCALEAPGQDPYFPLVLLLELIRACLLVVTAILLGGGTAYGGDEEIFALEEVRVKRAMAMAADVVNAGEGGGGGGGGGDGHSQATGGAKSGRGDSSGSGSSGSTPREHSSTAECRTCDVESSGSFGGAGSFSGRFGETTSAASAAGTASAVQQRRASMASALIDRSAGTAMKRRHAEGEVWTAAHSKPPPPLDTASVHPYCLLLHHLLRPIHSLPTPPPPSSLLSHTD